MVVFDDGFGEDAALAGGEELWTAPLVVPECEPFDWLSVLEQTQARLDEERKRANMLELRAEEHRRREKAERSRAQGYKRQLGAYRVKLKAARDELKAAGGSDRAPQSRSRAFKALERRVKAQDSEIADLRFSLHRSVEHRERIEARHRDEIQWLKGDMDHLRSLMVRVSRERNRVADSLQKQLERRLAAAKRRVQDREGVIGRLRDRNERLRSAVKRVTQRFASLREIIAGLRAEVRELKEANTELTSRVETLQGKFDKLRSSRSVLSRRMYGRQSEQQDKPGTGRKRGQQRGVAGHGRTPRPELEQTVERRHPPEEQRACSECLAPYVENGERSTKLIEIEVKAHTRKIVRGRWRRGCDCAASPREVTAPAVARVFRNTPYGVSVWACVLFERFVSRRPIHRVAVWLGDMGLRISAGTLADSVKRFLPLFEPLAAAILAHQNTAAVRHADETGWRVQAYRQSGRSSRAWLWTSVSAEAVYYLIDPSRSAEVAKRLFASLTGTVILVCDRYSGYKSLARQLAGKVILQWCWAHQRRSFLDCAAGHVRLTRWCRRWIERIARIYRLNDARLEHYDPDLERQTPAFDAAQGKLKQAVEALFASAEKELAGLSARALKAKPLRSLLNHREGLCVFLDNPRVPMDNNFAERLLRGAAIARVLSFGSDSVTGAQFTATMYTVTGTLAMNGIDVRRWLGEWLNACADNGGQPPEDLSCWLPWSMSPERRRALAAPG